MNAILSRRTISLAIVLSLSLLCVPAPQSKAAGYKTIHRVYSAYCGQSPCIVGPIYCGVLVGEWTQECDGSWSGWGQQPGESCTYFDTEWVYPCE